MNFRRDERKWNMLKKKELNSVCFATLLKFLDIITLMILKILKTAL